MTEVQPRTKQDEKDDAALTRLLESRLSLRTDEQIIAIIEGTTIPLSLARMFVAGIPGEFHFSNGEKRLINSRRSI